MGAGEQMSGFGAAIIGASLGGVHAVEAVLAALPDPFPVPVFVVQHRPEADPDRLAAILAARARRTVRAVHPGDPLEMSGVCVLPPSCGIEVGGNGPRVIAAGSRHSIDDVMTSLSGAIATPLIGVILTGLLDDGANGVRSIKRHGGRVLVQDPSTARAAAMPNAAVATGCADLVLPLSGIAPAIVALTMAPWARDDPAVPAPAQASLN